MLGTWAVARALDLVGEPVPDGCQLSAYFVQFGAAAPFLAGIAVTALNVFDLPCERV